ncbi:MAG: alpha/beta hydrolase [Pyrinomonadaceae bacterium MAG19_C2-C3]|nr:alpha/beta hydrolase [Pyrinomonadaceae bacterium MAG19_C2-C3]
MLNFYKLTRIVVMLIFCGLYVTANTNAQTALASEKTMTIYGAKIHYTDTGNTDAPVVVLLHGLGGNAANWALNVPALKENYRVIVPDQIGFGRSDKPFINYRIATYVDFLDRMLRDLKIEQATFVGNSMGGWVAARYALAHPAKVQRLVLVDAAGFALPKDADLRELSRLNPATLEDMRQINRLVFHNRQLFGTDAAIEFGLASRIAAGDGYTIFQLVESIKRGDDMLDGQLKNITQPTLIIWGRQDGLTPLAIYGERFKRELPNAQLVVIEDCGHVPQVEKAAEFNATLIRFLSAR